jgi:hypothetical protein
MGGDGPKRTVATEGDESDRTLNGDEWCEEKLSGRGSLKVPMRRKRGTSAKIIEFFSESLSNSKESISRL